MDDDQDTRPDDIMAPPMPASGNGVETSKDASANGASKDPARAVTDDTIADGVPALPADTIGPARTTRSKEPDPAPGEPSSSGDSPAWSFAPSVPAQPAAETRTAADPAESAAKRPAADPAPAAPSGTAPSGTAPSGRSPSATSPKSADPPAVPAAAFAWEMPDPPPQSPSSPARTFLRSGAAAKSAAAKTPAAPKAAPSASAGAAAAAATTAAAQKPVTARRGAAKAQSKQAPSKRTTARQAHLTIARLEPWSVMKFSFVVSLVAFVILFVAVAVLYGVLSAVGVFDSLQRVVTSLTSSQGSAGVNAKAWFTESKVLGYTAMLGAFNIVLITAMATIGAVVYNLTSRLVGGVEVTLRETE